MRSYAEICWAIFHLGRKTDSHAACGLLTGLLTVKLSSKKFSPVKSAAAFEVAFEILNQVSASFERRTSRGDLSLSLSLGEQLMSFRLVQTDEEYAFCSNFLCSLFDHLMLGRPRERQHSQTESFDEKLV